MKIKNVASLLRLIKLAKEFLESTFESKNLENIKLLKEISSSNLYKRLSKLRNKKFGHSDSDEINNPWKIEGFTGGQIEEMRSQVETLLKVFNNIFGAVFRCEFWIT
jgi:hypothetical protein